MFDTITLTGIVASEPRAITTHEGLAVTSFRLASPQRHYDRGAQKWVDGETNWYSVTTFRQLATNSAVSLKKGERILVTGRLRIKDWSNGTKSGTNIDVDADALGHDLSWGTANFSRGSGSGSVDVGSTFPSDAQLAAASAGGNYGADREDELRVGEPGTTPGAGASDGVGDDIGADSNDADALADAAADSFSAADVVTPF